MSAPLREAAVQAIGSGDLAAAERLCRRLAEGGDPDEAAHLLAVVRHRQGRGAEALELFGRAVRAQPGRADIAGNHAFVLRQAGRLDAAIAEWRRALALAPGNIDAAYNLARALTETGRPVEAAELYAALLRLQPGHRDAAFNLGNLLHRRGEYRRAAQVFASLAQAHPRFAPGLVNFGMTLAVLGRDAEAEGLYRAALALDPACVEAHWNLAMVLLAGGRWREGLEEFEWRLRLPEAPKPTWPRPRWWGDDPAGRRILVWNDQGRGDAIQFLRYAGQLAELGCTVYACLQADLVRLAAGMPGIAGAFGFDQSLPDFDAHAPLLSLPLLLGHDGPARGWTGPYVVAAPRPELPPRLDRKRIGVVWAGNPGHANDSNRSMSLATLAPLFAVDGVDWVSLQHGPAARQLDGSPWAFAVRDLSPLLTDFAATAGLVAQLDLVLTVDTAMAHLVGAMGRPVWLLLPAQGIDWRWGRCGAATPWYPGMRLFRQDAAGEWAPVIAEVAEAVRRLA